MLLSGTELNNSTFAWKIEVDCCFQFLTVLQCMQAFFSANAAAQASRKSSPRVNNEAVQKAVSTLKDVV